MKNVTALVAGIFLAGAIAVGCSPQGSAFVNEDQGNDNPDATPQNKNDLNPDGLPDANLPNDNIETWILAPDGECDKPENQAYANAIKDGDTIQLSGLYEGADTVRYIGVNAPETKTNQCWSHEAEKELSSMTPHGKPICLLRDTNSAPKDQYGRLLRYVFFHNGNQWVMQNARLVRMGSARAFHKYLDGKDYKWEIKNAEKDAMKELQGGWANCNWQPEY